MKKVFFTLAISGLLVSCTDNKEIEISGTVRNMQGRQIVYFQSVDGMFNSQSYDTLNINPDSTYTLILPAEEYKRVRFVLWGKGELGTVITNKSKIEVNLDWNTKQHIEVKGLDEKVLLVSTLLDQLNNDVWDLRARRGDRWNISKDTVVSSVVSKLKSYEQDMDEKMKGVDDDLYNKARQDVRMQLMLAFQYQLFGVNWGCSSATKKKWLEEWGNIRSLYTDDDSNSPFSPAFYDVANNNAGIIYYIKEEKVPEGVDKNPNELSFHYYEHNLSGKAQEAAMAQLFLQDEIEERNSPVMIPLSEHFIKMYPQSKWMPYVNRAVAKNKAFNEANIPDYIHFPDVANAKTIKDVIDRYKGKVIFMDIWATWCGPCRSSFSHVKPLQEYAEQHDDVVLLYLSIDRKEDDEKWRKMAAHYDLMGEHVRVQDGFRDEVYKTFGNKRGALSIPRCIILDKKGNIRFSVAASPENMEKLKLQLEEAANDK